MKVNKNSSEDVDLAPIFTHKKAVIKREGEKRGMWRKREGRNGKDLDKVGEKSRAEARANSSPYAALFQYWVRENKKKKKILP